MASCGSGGREAEANSPATTAPPEKGALLRAAKSIEPARPPLSTAEFASRVNALCHRAWPAIRHDLATYKSHENPGLSERKSFKRAISNSMIPDIEKRIFDPILALGAPRGNRSELQETMHWLGEAIEIGKGQFPIILPALVWDLFDMFNPLANRYGLHECLVNPAHTQLEG